MYSKQVAEHIAHPRNIGELDSPSAVGDVVNEACMDRLRLTLRIDGGRVAEARVKVQGCPPTIAAASVLTELLVGRSIREAELLQRKDVAEALGHLPPAKKHCAALAIDAVRAALQDYAEKNR